MISYLLKYQDKLTVAFLEHLELVLICLLFSLLLASILTILCMYFKILQKIFIDLFSMIYAIPSLALFSMLIPLTGFGIKTEIIVLVLYNQYLLLYNFITGFNEVDHAVVDAAMGMGMTNMQTLLKIQLPLSKKALTAGLRLTTIPYFRPFLTFLAHAGLREAFDNTLQPTLDYNSIQWAANSTQPPIADYSNIEWEAVVKSGLSYIIRCLSSEAGQARDMSLACPALRGKRGLFTSFGCSTPKKERHSASEETAH